MIRKWTAVSGTLLVAVFLLVVYQEMNPEWKWYQTRFNELELAKLQESYQEAEKTWNTPSTVKAISNLRGEYEKAKAEFEKPFTQSSYKKTLARLKQAETELEKVQDVIQKTRARYQSVEREYLLSDDPRDQKEMKTKLDQHRSEIDNLLAQRERAQKTVDRFKREAVAFTARLEEVKKQLYSFRMQQEKFLSEIVKLKQRLLEIKQLIPNDLQVVDRCMTCHAAATGKGFFHEGTIFSSHPPYYLNDHPPEKFGCTSCHGGQGRATHKVAAHGKVPHWQNPLIPEQFLGGSCGQCHMDLEIPFEPYLNDGRKLFHEAGCVGCHDVAGLRPKEKIGPDLSKIGDKVKADWLFRWLKNPKDYLSRTRMPNFLMSDEEIRNVRQFLLRQKGNVEYSVPVNFAELVSKSSSVTEGEKLFKELRCISCHAVNGRGGTIGPELTKVAGKVNENWLFGFLQDPKAYFPRTRMPRYRLSNQEVIFLVAYITSEFQDFDISEQEKPSPTFSVNHYEISKGETVVGKYGCYGCHDIPGFEKITKVGVELDGFADKPVERLDFGIHKEVKRNWYDWTMTKLGKPRIFREGLKMPDYGFTDYEVKVLTVFLKTLIENNIPASYKINTKPSTYAPEGKFGKLIEDLNCLVCHAIRGRGGTLAPDLSYEGSRAKSDWLSNFLKNPYAIRLYMEERMPKFKLTAEEVEIIVSYIKMVLVENSIPEKIFADGAITPELQAKGKQLYFEKCGCQSCHQIGMSGGAIGPELTDVSNRLEEGWIYTWLKGSKRLVPNVKEPDFLLSDEEARALTAFLINPNKDEK